MDNHSTTLVQLLFVPMSSSAASRPLEFLLFVLGAPPEAIEKGINAAWEVFEASEAWPWDCAAAAFDRSWEQHRPNGRPDSLPPELHRLADIWEFAEAAGFAAAWPLETCGELPDEVHFQILGAPTFKRQFHRWGRDA